MRSLNAGDLAFRDPAFAAMMGVGPSSFGDDDVHGDGFGEVDPHMGDDPFNGDSFGGAPAPTQAQAAAAWQKLQAARARGHRRANLLEPNSGSSKKIERYTFAIPMTAPSALGITMGTQATVTFSGNPKVRIRPQRMVTNINEPFILFLTSFQVSNVDAQVGGGSVDAWIYNPNAQGVMQDFPTVEPAIPVTVNGSYTGATFGGFAPSPPVQFPLSLAFIGPADMAGSGTC